VKRLGATQWLHRRTGRKNIAGTAIRKSRQELGWTMEYLGVLLEQTAELELSIATIEKIEKGTRSLYDYEVVAFAAVLQVELTYLLNGKFADPSKIQNES
jgi:transcriptional regulator with XRE-family HTH domain